MEWWLGQIDEAFWSLLLSEHRLDPQGVRVWPVPLSLSSSRVFYSPLPLDGPSVSWHMFAQSAQIYNGMNPLKLDRITNYLRRLSPVPAKYMPRSTQVNLESGTFKSVSPVVVVSL